ncbi:hypothetical protein ACMFMG_005678 [Clarireedia jacksonii]
MEDPQVDGKASFGAESTTIDNNQLNIPNPNDSKFINITDPVPFDKETRTKVRVEVMRDYHRKRIQKGGSSATVGGNDDGVKKHESVDPKSRMTKFRLDSEKSLTPWKPLTKRRKRKRGGDEEVVRLDVCFGVEAEEEGRLATQGGNRHIRSSERSDVWMGVEDLNAAALQHWDPSILYSPSSSTVDPFASTSVLITPRIQVLLYHYFSLRLPSSWMMMPMRHAFFALSIHDDALFYTYLSHYAASYHSHFRTGSSLESVFYRSRAIELVNARLMTQDLNEGTVAAVANMAIYDSSNGSKESMKVHLQGLRKMVELRGGLQEGGFSQHIQRLIAWTDINTANILSEKPHFPPLTLGLLTSINDPSSTATPTLDNILSTLRILSQTPPVTNTINSFPHAQNSFFYSDQIYHIQRHLIDLSHPTPSPSPPSHSPHSYPPLSASASSTPAFALALLIFSYRCLRDISFTFNIMHTFAERLKHAVLALSLPPSDSVSTEKTLWILTLGAMVSENKPSHGFFVQRLREMRKRVVWRMGGEEGGGWTEGREVLGRVLWHGELDEVGERVWKESGVGA